MTTPHFIYAICPSKDSVQLPFIKLGRWSGSVKKLKERYMTYYGSFDMTVFECTDSVPSESSLFKSLRSKHWVRELYEPDVFPDFLRVAASLCFDKVTHYDMLDDREIRDLKVKHKAELDAIRSRLMETTKGPHHRHMKKRSLHFCVPKQRKLLAKKRDTMQRKICKGQGKRPDITMQSPGFGKTSSLVWKQITLHAMDSTLVTPDQQLLTGECPRLPSRFSMTNWLNTWGRPLSQRKGLAT